MWVLSVCFEFLQTSVVMYFAQSTVKFLGIVRPAQAVCTIQIVWNAIRDWPVTNDSRYEISYFDVEVFECKQNYDLPILFANGIAAEIIVLC